MPAAISLLVVDCIVRDEAKAMKLPSIGEALKAGLHLKIYPLAFLSSSLVLLLYLGIFIPEYYGLSGQEWMLAEFMVMMWLLIYYLFSLYSALVATLVMYTFFALGLRLFWNIDILLNLFLFVILAPTLVTMRYVRKLSSSVAGTSNGTSSSKESVQGSEQPIGNPIVQRQNKRFVTFEIVHLRLFTTNPVYPVNLANHANPVNH